MSARHALPIAPPAGWDDGREAAILLVDGRSTARKALRHTLEFAGFAVTTAADGMAALEEATRVPYDVVLLDLDLPRLSAMEVCRRLRAASSVRIVVLSGDDSEADRILLLGMGADDVLVRPVSERELTTRLRAMLRRRLLDAGAEPVRLVGPLRIDLARHEVSVDNHPVRVTPSEFKILALLSERPGRAYTRTEIVQELWQSAFVGDRRSCDIHIKNLRRKMEPDPANPRTLLTVRGVGYRLAADGEAKA